MNYLYLWCGSGLLGTTIWFVKNTAFPRHAVILAIVTIPLALVLGPIWLLIQLTGYSVKKCPYCKSAVRGDATVCPHCTRSQPE